MVFVSSGGCFRYTVWLRLTQAAKKQSRILFSIIYLIFRQYTYKYGVHIDTNIPIGKGLLIVHGDGVYLNCKSVGDYLTIYQNVTVGANASGIPEIKNNVTLYTGCLCIGNIVLENEVEVGGNAVLCSETEKGGVYVGIPAKLMKKK